MYLRYTVEFTNVMGHWTFHVIRVREEKGEGTRAERVIKGTIDGLDLEGDVELKPLLWELFCAAAAEDEERRRKADAPRHGGHS